MKKHHRIAGQAFVARATAPRRAFTLLEMVVVMWALLILMLFGTTMLFGTMQAREAVGAAHQYQTQRSALADQFRTDVAVATAAPDSFGGEQAGPKCLVLRLGDGSHTIYRWEDGKLERRSIVDGKTSRQQIAVGRPSTTLEFGREGGRLLVLRLSEAPGQQVVVWPTVIEAALGGDLR
jgi:prepilin-type N-terminal cleavage/methylation domain-containing protein